MEFESSNASQSDGKSRGTKRKRDCAVNPIDTTATASDVVDIPPVADRLVFYSGRWGVARMARVSSVFAKVRELAAGRSWTSGLGRVAATLRGYAQDDIVTSLAVLRDGYVATGSTQGQVKIWECAAGRLSKTLDFPPPFARTPVCCLAALEDGSLASGLLDGSIVRSENPIRGNNTFVTSEGLHMGPVQCIAELGGRRLVSASSDGRVQIQVWGHRGVGRFHLPDILCLVTLGEHRLACGRADGTVLVIQFPGDDFQLLDGRSTKLVAHRDAVFSLAKLDGDRLATGSTRSMKIWDLSSAACVAMVKVNDGPVYSLAVMHSGRLVGSSTSTVTIWDIATGEVARLLGSDTITAGNEQPYHGVWSQAPIAILEGGRLLIPHGPKNVLEIFE